MADTESRLGDDDQLLAALTEKQRSLVRRMERLQAMARADAETISRAIIAADQAAVVEAVAPLPAGRRSDVGSALYTVVPSTGLDSEQTAAFAIARLGTATEAWDMASSLASLLAVPATEAPPAVLDLFRARGRRWTDSVVRGLFRPDWYRGEVWRAVAALVQADLADEPDSPAWATWSLHAYPWEDLPGRVRSDPQLARSLRHAFDVPGAGLVLSVCASTQRPESLVEALTGGTDEGRADVLDALIGTLGNPFTENDLRGWKEFAGWLAPTDDELAGHAASVVALLAAPSRVSVGWAQAALARDGVRCDAESLVDVSDAVLARPDKGLVRAQLRLLQRRYAEGDLAADSLVRVLAQGLDPDRPDLARATAAVLREALPAAGPEARRDVVAVIDARFSGTGDALRTELGLPAGASAAVAEPIAPPTPVDLPRAGAVESVRDVDELVDLLARIPVGDSAPEDLERALDGLVRFRPEDARTLTALTHTFHPDQPTLTAPDWTMAASFVDLVRAWLGVPVGAAVDGVRRRGGSIDRPEDAPPGAAVAPEPWASGTLTWREPSWVPPMLTYRRMVELRAVVGSGALLLSTPTSSDGSIDGEALVRRLAQAPESGARWAPHDVGTALLRLEPSTRAELEAVGALSLHELVSASTADALRTLGVEDRWVRETMDRPFTHYAPAGRVTGWFVPGSARGAPDDPVLGWLDTSTVRTGWHDHFSVVDWHDARWGAGPRHWATVLVHDPDLLGAHLLPLLSMYADRPRADLLPVLRALGSSRAPLHGPASAALVRLAAFRDVTVRTGAAEALAGAARSGRLDADVLGEELLALLVPDADGVADDLPPKLNRLVETLTDAARIDDHAEAAVLGALRVLMTGAHRLRGSADAVELTAQLAERRGIGVELPEGLAAVAASRSSSHLAVAARRLAATVR
ncbi:hypothetical protein [Cellulomonas terrae]|uniref:Secreted protein n=1 Tax=Cellulomonas terrae TaxID=311234 RepID=A0A511JIG3_9CELL|nr:hypothetical protein [Cellulomonas terrae]GEL97801.1 hypothetical protein CTE05_13480 [Cellulomonas terrae]